MSKLKDYIDKLYRADPTKLVRCANTAFRLVHIGRRYWRGYRVMKDADVTLDGAKVNDKSATKPRWKLCPEQLKDEFMAHERGLEEIIKDYFFSGVGASKALTESISILLRGGTYAVPVGSWPRAQQMLRKAQSAWDNSADRWTTDDGHLEFCKLLEEQLGAEDYAKVVEKELIPDQNTLRASFGLFVTELPVLIAEDRSSTDAEDSGRIGLIGEIMESAIREPRTDAVEAWETLAAQLVMTDGTVVKPLRRHRIEKDGKVSEGFRSCQKASVLAARKAADRTTRCGPAMDEKFRQAVVSVIKELPDTVTEASVIAKKLNMDDNEAVRVGTVLIKAAAVAASEDSMCDALSAALGNRLTP